MIYTDGSTLDGRMHASTSHNKQEYANLHGYQFFNFSKTHPKARHIGKLHAILDAMTEPCEWIFFVDNDALISDMSVRLETLVAPRAHMVVSADCNYFDKSFNSGVMLLRASRITKRLLRTAIRKYDPHRHSQHDQDALIEAWGTVGRRGVICREDMQRFPSKTWSRKFVVHKAGCTCCFPIDDCIRDLFSLL